MLNRLYGAVEFGGTKVNCMVAESLGAIIDRTRIPTTSPDETLAAVISFFSDYLPLRSIGIGSFGPLDLDPASPSYGCILSTPKPGWSDINILGRMRDELACNIFIDTDVNAAGLAEYQLGAGRHDRSIIYTTVGTGIGSGFINDGVSLKGPYHPEMGHFELVRDVTDTAFESCCPFHTSCAEGIASGTAIDSRWGKSLDKFDYEHDAWRLEAAYLARYAHTLMLAFAPQRLIFGGGVSCEPLLVRVRDELYKLLGGYLRAFPTRESLDEYLVMPALGDEAGPIGSLLLAVNNTNDAQAA